MSEQYDHVVIGSARSVFTGDSYQRLGWIWKVVRTSRKILATPLGRVVQSTINTLTLLFVCS